MNIVTFTCESPPRLASTKFRTMVGEIQPLSKSLLARHPGFEAVLDGFDANLHTSMRKFFSAGELSVFVYYLDKLISRSPHPHPKLYFDGPLLIYYRTVSNKAAIGIGEKDDGKWLVFGYVKDQPDREFGKIIKCLANEGFDFAYHGDDFYPSQPLRLSSLG